jgi:hypothetical protein
MVFRARAGLHRLRLVHHQNPSIMDFMHCPERDNLVRILANSVLAFGEAVRSMSGADGEALQRARQWSETAHSLCEDCRTALAEHESTHGCAAKASTASGR